MTATGSETGRRVVGCEKLSAQSGKHAGYTRTDPARITKREIVRRRTIPETDKRKVMRCGTMRDGGREKLLENSGHALTGTRLIGREGHTCTEERMPGRDGKLPEGGTHGRGRRDGGIFVERHLPCS